MDRPVSGGERGPLRSNTAGGVSRPPGGGAWEPVPFDGAGEVGRPGGDIGVDGGGVKDPLPFNAASGVDRSAGGVGRCPVGRLGRSTGGVGGGTVGIPRPDRSTAANPAPGPAVVSGNARGMWLLPGRALGGSSGSTGHGCECRPPRAAWSGVEGPAACSRFGAPLRRAGADESAPRPLEESARCAFLRWTSSSDSQPSLRESCSGSRPPEYPLRVGGGPSWRTGGTPRLPLCCGPPGDSVGVPCRVPEADGAPCPAAGRTGVGAPWRGCWPSEPPVGSAGGVPCRGVYPLTAGRRAEPLASGAALGAPAPCRVGGRGAAPCRGTWPLAEP